MAKLIEINSLQDIPQKYRGTPIEKLFRYHNFGEPLDTYTNAQMLVGMCMDNRKQLRIPENFAFIIRSGGGNLRHSEFKVSYAIAIGRLSTVAVIAHNNCGMVNIISQKENFINGLVETAGWQKSAVEEYFMSYAPFFEIGNEIDFVTTEATRLRSRYPKVSIVPLFYKIENNKLYCIEEA